VIRSVFLKKSANLKNKSGTFVTNESVYDVTLNRENSRDSMRFLRHWMTKTDSHFEFITNNIQLLLISGKAIIEYETDEKSITQRSRSIRLILDDGQEFSTALIKFSPLLWIKTHLPYRPLAPMSLQRSL
jgi:uncharacterized alpha/beta hydrolase family protein